MTLAHSTQMVKAYPLGEPVNGMPRHSMLPAQAILYRDLVDRFGNDPAQAFKIDQRRTAKRLGFGGKVNLMWQTKQLCDRGWLEKVFERGAYRLVEPIMRFPKVPTRWEEQ
jgi:hypothetical protein